MTESPQPHSIDSGTYAGILIRLYLKRMWWAYALPAVCFLLIGARDIRFLLLALIYVFLVTPMVMAFAFTFYGLVKESRYSILRHRIGFDMREIHVIYVDADDCKIGEDKIGWEGVKLIHPTSKHLIVMLSAGQFRFIAIPYTAFTGKDEMLSFINLAKSYNIECR